MLTQEEIDSIFFREKDVKSRLVCADNLWQILHVKILQSTKQGKLQI